MRFRDATLPLNPHPVRTIKRVAAEKGGMVVVEGSIEALGGRVISRHCSIERLLGNQPKPFLQTLANYMNAL